MMCLVLFYNIFIKITRILILLLYIFVISVTNLLQFIQNIVFSDQLHYIYNYSTHEVLIKYIITIITILKRNGSSIEKRNQSYYITCLNSEVTT